MVEHNAWTRDPHVHLAYRVWIYAAGIQDRGYEHSVTAIADTLGVDQAEVGSVLAELLTAGHIQDDQRMGLRYPASLVLTSSGEAALREFQRRNRTRHARRMACEDALLDWLSANEEHNRLADINPNLTDDPMYFTSDVRANFLGVPFENDIVRESTRHLMELDLVHGTRTAQGTTLFMRITPTGHDVVDHFDGDVAGWRRRHSKPSQVPHATITIGDHATAAVALNSPGASLTITQTNDSQQQFLVLSRALAQAIPVLGLDPKQRGDAERLVEELQVVEPSKDRALARRLVERVKEIAVAGAGSALGEGLVALAIQIASRLSL